MGTKPSVFVGVFLFLGTACASSGGGSNPDGGGGSGTCNAGETRCDGNTFQTCSGSGWETSNLCPVVCDDTLGCVDCNPGRAFCMGEDSYECTDQGEQGDLVETCTGTAHCEGGQCVDLCAEAEASQSYIGCEYFAADLDNAVDLLGPKDDLLGCFTYQALQPGAVEIQGAQVCVPAEDGAVLQGFCDADGSCPEGSTCTTQDVCGLDAESSPFAIVVSNPQSFPAEVVLSDATGQNRTVEVAAGQVTALYPQDMGFADTTVKGTGISAGAYRIVSDAPVVAYQFNPLNNENVFSNDGSLLLPRHTYDTRYYAMTWPSLVNRPAAKDYNGYIAVVAWDDATEITVTPTAGVRASLSEGAIAAGASQSFTLDAFEVLNLEAVGDGDLTGTLLEASGDDPKSFAVLAGHEAVAILAEGADCCADHIEEMMFPASTWGTEYAIARSEPRGSETDLIRILAQTDGTAVTVTSGSCPTLNAGEFCDVEISGDVEISADQPILVGHYLKSTISTFGGGIGDPSLAIAVPTEQYRSSYTFLVPEEYDMQYVSVVAQAGGDVTLDGEAIDSKLQSFGSGSFAAGRVGVAPGQHTLRCTGGCGLEVFGYSDAVSYLFAGGLDLERIVVD